MPFEITAQRQEELELHLPMALVKQAAFPATDLLKFSALLNKHRCSRQKTNSMSNYFLPNDGEVCFYVENNHNQISVTYWSFLQVQFSATRTRDENGSLLLTLDPCDPNEP